MKVVCMKSEMQILRFYLVGRDAPVIFTLTLYLLLSFGQFRDTLILKQGQTNDVKVSIDIKLTAVQKRLYKVDKKIPFI